MHCHDSLEAHHDKDLRCLSVFQVAALKNTRVTIWRVNLWGQLEVDHVVCGDPSRTAVVLTHKGHMRALRSEEVSPEETSAAWVLAGKTVKNYAGEGGFPGT